MAAPLALWVTPVSEPGGVARHVLDVARAGIPGFRLAVLCPPGWLADELRALDAAVLTGTFGPDAVGAAGFADADALSSSRGGSSPDDDAAAHRAVTTARAAAASSATLRHAVRTLQPAVVHTHLAYADLIGAAVLRGPLLRGVPRAVAPTRQPVLVTTEHGISGDPRLYHGSEVRARVMAQLHSRRLRRTDGVVAVSRATARTMTERWKARDVVVIPNGMDRAPGGRPPAGEARARGSAPRVLSLSRLAPEKGLDTLVHAMAVLRRGHPNARLTLAGNGPERDRLRDLVRSLGLEDAVSMPGHVTAGEALARHDVLVQLSRWENCSYSLLDAAAAGLGVVATDVGGNREILPERCLVPPDITDLAERVARLVVRQTEPEQRPTLPEEWPRVEDMTRELGRCYTGFLTRSGVPS